MMHLSITEGAGEPDKPETNWGDHVTDTEYRAASSSPSGLGLAAVHQ